MSVLLLTPVEVAQALRLSVVYVRELIRIGDIPSIRPGKRNVFVSEADLQKFIETRRRGGSGGTNKGGAA